MEAEHDAFVEECRAIDGTLEEMPGEAWTRPGLGEWDVAELVAHMVRGAGRVAAYVDEPAPGEPQLDRVSYWQFDLEAEAPAIARRAAEEAARVDAETLPALFNESWRASAERAGELPRDRVLATPHGPIRLDEYLATRVLEMVVHHTDLRAALEQPPVSTIAAARITLDVLESLLGGPRPRNLGRARFIQVATGRLPSDDPRMPVLR